MGKKIFISYKYGDGNVQPLNNQWFTTVRHYVDKIQELIGEEHINKGENDGESMASLTDSTIQSKLGDKIYDSSITIVLISPNMKASHLPEREQWIPWEVSYSLREQSRNGRVSKTNAMLAVVLPDFNGSYDYFLQEHSCPHCNSTTHKTHTLFDILSSNMFNRKTPIYSTCPHHSYSDKPHMGDFSYIHCVKWNNFISNHNLYLNIAERIKENITDYNITKNLK